MLTFYQERIANEGYLRTATERRSVLELARLVGYEPRPGVAASVFLAYTLDDTVSGEVLIPAGSQAQSVPGPGEIPQLFETSQPLARSHQRESKCNPTHAAANREGYPARPAHSFKRHRYKPESKRSSSY